MPLTPTIALLLPWFLLENQLFTLLRLPCMRKAAPLLLLSRFSLYLPFDSMITMHPVVDIIVFILLGICWASWLCRFLSFNKFGKSLLLCLQEFYSVPFSHFLFGTPMMHMLLCLMASYNSLRLFIFLHF